MLPERLLEIRRTQSSNITLSSIKDQFNSHTHTHSLSSHNCLSSNHQNDSRQLRVGQHGPWRLRYHQSAKAQASAAQAQARVPAQGTACLKELSRPGLRWLRCRRAKQHRVSCRTTSPSDPLPLATSVDFPSLPPPVFYTFFFPAIRLLRFAFVFLLVDNTLRARCQSLLTSIRTCSGEFAFYLTTEMSVCDV